MDQLWQDVRQGARTLVRHRGSAALAAGCLAVGIGVAITMFTTADPWLFRPLPFADPDRLVALGEVHPRGWTSQASVPAFFDWKEQGRSLGEVGAFVRLEHNLSTEDEPERVQGAAITAGLFPLLGVRPVEGRGFAPGEDLPGGPRVCLIGDRLWRRRFAGLPGVVGRTLRIDGEVHAIVGILPPRWAFPEYAEVWTPLALDPTDRDRGRRHLDVIARLRPGALAADAESEVAAIASRAARESPETSEGWGGRAVPLLEAFVPPGIRTALYLMLAATGLVLLIACANVANLMLAQASERRREIATRLALGAPPRRLARRLLVEGLLLSLAGAALGVPLAFWGTEWMRASVPVQPPFWAELVVGPRVVFATLAASVLAALVFGLFPALQAARLDLRSSLQEGGRGAAGGDHGRRLADRLVAAELAVCVMLLSGAALMVRSFQERQRADLGFEVEGALVGRLSLSGERYREPEARTVFLEEGLRRIRALPGVEAAAAVTSLPLSDELGGGWSTVPFEVEGRPVPPAKRPTAVYQGATAQGLEALGIAIVAGRALQESEVRDAAAVGVVSEGLARRHFPEGDALGRRLRVDGGAWLRVVGVAREVREPASILGVESKPSGQLYVPYTRDPARTVLIAVRGPRPEALAAPVREELRALDPSLPLYGVRTLAELRRRADWVALLWGQLLAWAAGAGALLAATGVYGVVSRGVARRTQEIGVRMALGAAPRAVLGLVLGQGLRMALLGGLLGLAGALLLTRSLASLLYGVSSSDPLTLTGSVVLLIGVALLASWAPARRATRVDPLAALRNE